jgi:hypothetical protein
MSPLIGKHHTAGYISETKSYSNRQWIPRILQNQNINNLPIDPYCEPGKLSLHLPPPLARPPDHALVSKFPLFHVVPLESCSHLFSRKSCPSVPPNFHRTNNACITVGPHYTVTTWFLLLPPFRSDILLGKSILTNVGHWSSLSVPDQSNILCTITIHTFINNDMFRR